MGLLAALRGTTSVHAQSAPGTGLLDTVAGRNAPVVRAAGTFGRTRRPTADDPHLRAPKVLATRVASAITLDGRLNDPAWSAAEPATGFRQTEPVDGAAASEQTEVRIVYDDEAVYVGARLYDRTGHVSSRLGRRDAELTDSDWFIVVFDSYHDHLGGFRFKVNPSGVTGDEANGERSWNPVWTVATSIDSLGWTAELRIPFSQLRFGSASEQEWGIQFLREIRSTAE